MPLETTTRYVVFDTKGKRYYCTKDTWREDICEAKMYKTNGIAEGIRYNCGQYHLITKNWAEVGRYPAYEDLVVLPVELSVKLL